MNRPDLQGQPFLVPHLGIVAQGHGGGGEVRHQEIHDLRQTPLHARMQGLNGQVAGVGVHHQARKPVRLPVDQAAGVGVGHHPAPIVQGPFEPGLPKVPVHRFVAFGHHPQGDAGRGAVKGLAQETASRVGSRPPGRPEGISGEPSRSLR